MEKWQLCPLLMIHWWRGNSDLQDKWWQLFQSPLSTPTTAHTEWKPFSALDSRRTFPCTTGVWAARWKIGWWRPTRGSRCTRSSDAGVRTVLRTSRLHKSCVATTDAWRVRLSAANVFPSPPRRFCSCEGSRRSCWTRIACTRSRWRCWRWK